MKNPVSSWRKDEFGLLCSKMKNRRFLNCCASEANKKNLSDINIKKAISCLNSMIFPWFYIIFQIPRVFHAWKYFQPFSRFSRVCWLVVLRLNVPVNNFSVMSGRSHRFLGNSGYVGTLKISAWVKQTMKHISTFSVKSFTRLQIVKQ